MEQFNDENYVKNLYKYDSKLKTKIKDSENIRNLNN